MVLLLMCALAGRAPLIILDETFAGMNNAMTMTTIVPKLFLTPFIPSRNI